MAAQMAISTVAMTVAMTVVCLELPWVDRTGNSKVVPMAFYWGVRWVDEWVGATVRQMVGRLVDLLVVLMGL